jgi:predicted transcriptional regulator
MSRTSERRKDPTAQVLNGPALRMLEAAHRSGGALTREGAATANSTGVKTADDYLRALEKLGLLTKESESGRVAYRLAEPGRALVERRKL